MQKSMVHPQKKTAIGERRLKLVKRQNGSVNRTHE
jgi:hypothetical protein